VREEAIEHIKEAEEMVKTQYFGAKEKLDYLVQSAQSDVDNFDIDLDKKHDPIIEAKEKSVTHTVGELAFAQSSLKRLIAVEQPSVAVEEIGKLQAQLETFNKEKAEKQSLIDNNPYVDMILTLETSIAKIQTDIDGVDAEIKAVEAKMPYHQFWVDHMGKEGIKSFVIDQIIPTLNQQIDYWMQLIYQGAITVKFDKYFNVSMVNNASKNEMIFGQGSGGERRRIDIAVMLAFRQIMKMSTGKDPNILFFDEVAENLDEEGVYRLFDAMQDIAKTSHLYVITHNPTLLHLLQNSQVINVVKKDGAMKLAA
jgi:DNA repair exonuclease SbcCD ATPase subunit